MVDLLCHYLPSYVPRRTIQITSQPQNLTREVVPVEENNITQQVQHVDKTIVVEVEAVNLPQIDNPDVEDDFPSNDSVASNDWDNVADNNQVVLDNPAVPKRAQDDTGSDGSQRPEKGAKTNLGSVAYCNSGFSSLGSMANINAIEGQRVIGRSRKWLEEDNTYGEWTVHTLELTSEYSVSFHMRRGGTNEFFPQIITNVS